MDRPPVTWHESVEGSPDDAPLDETQAVVDEDVKARAAAFEAEIEQERQKWARVYELVGSSTVNTEGEAA